MNAFFSGVGLGLMLASLIGPVFFALIETSMRRGFQLALMMALGITCSDVCYIVTTYFGFKYLADDTDLLHLFGIGGGVVLILFGLAVLLGKGPNRTAQSEEYSIHDKWKAFLKGFVLNFINPSVLLFWVGSVGLIAAKYKNDSIAILTFFAGTSATILLTDLLKAKMAFQISGHIRDSWIIYLQRTVGVGMILFGGKLLWDNVYF